MKWPKLVDFDHPEREGLDGAINYYLESEPKMKIGVWQILPKSLVMDSQSKSKDWFLQSLSTGMPIVIYFHGNTGSRARDHRIYMYQVSWTKGKMLVCSCLAGANDLVYFIISFFAKACHILPKLTENLS